MNTDKTENTNSPKLPEKANPSLSSSSTFRGRKFSKVGKSDPDISKLNIELPPDSEPEPPKQPDTPHPSFGAHTLTTLDGTTTTFPAGPGENLLQNPHNLDAIAEKDEELTGPKEFPESPIDIRTASATSSILSAAPSSSHSSIEDYSSSYEQVRGLEGKTQGFEGENKHHHLTTHFSPFTKKSPRGALPGSIHSSESTGVVGSCSFSQGKFTIHTKHTANFTLVFDRPMIHLPKAGGQVKDFETPMTIFHEWLKDPGEATKRSEQIERVHYSDDAIAPAIGKFEKEFNCNWSLLKRAFKKGDVKPEEMQIIQDLRAAYNFYILQDLTQHFSKQGFVFQAINTGSPTLGSDADFGLDIHAKEGSLDEITLQAKQAEAIILFNGHYERIWKHPSAIIFDTNAYSKQYVRQIHDDVLDKENSIYQTNASITMRMKLAHDTWGIYVDKVFKKLVHKGNILKMPADKLEKALQEKQNQFKSITDRYTQLENAKLVKIIEVSLAPHTPHHSTHYPELRRWQKFIQDLRDTIDTPSTQKTVRDLVEVIKSHNPDIEIWASNLLHEDSERRCAMLEDTRYKLLDFLKQMNEEAVQGKGQRFNALIDRLTHDFQSRLTHEQNDEIRVAYSNYLGRLKFTKFDERFTVGSKGVDLDVALEKCFKHAAELHEQKVKIQKVLKSLAALILLKDKAQLLEKPDDKTLVQRKEMLLQDLPHTPIKIEGENYERAYQTAVEELRKINNEINGLYSTPLGEKVQLIYGMADNILIDVQKSTAVGQYYAQAALMSIGAYAYVVINLQQKSLEVRSISHYCQAFNEVMAYYENHQQFQGKPLDKLVEVSKDGERAILALEDLRLKTSLLKIDRPDFTADLTTIPGHSPEEKMYKLRKFFSDVLAIRKGMVGDKLMDAADKQDRLKKAASLIGIQLGDKEEFSEKHLSAINEMMMGLATTLEAWRSGIPLNIQNI